MSSKSWLLTGACRAPMQYAERRIALAIKAQTTRELITQYATYYSRKGAHIVECEAPVAFSGYSNVDESGNHNAGMFDEHGK